MPNGGPVWQRLFPWNHQDDEVNQTQWITKEQRDPLQTYEQSSAIEHQMQGTIATDYVDLTPVIRQGFHVQENPKNVGQVSPYTDPIASVLANIARFNGMIKK